MRFLTVSSILLCTTLLFAQLISTHGAPRSRKEYGSDMGAEYENHLSSNDMARWLLAMLPRYNRQRRTSIDAGFLSRHSSLNNYLEAYEAAKQARDPHGPGRRK